MKPLNFKYQYFALVFIFLFIIIGSVNATDNSNYNDNNGDSSSIMVSSTNQINEDSVMISSNKLAIDDSVCSDFNQTYFNQTTIKNRIIDDDKSINSLSSSKTTRTVISSKGLTLNYGSEGYVVGYLKTSSGKAISGKVVKITINSQTWSKTTDSNGKVSLKIMNLTPDIYSTKFSFAGGSGYSASSYLVNVTVNKLSTKIIADDLYLYNDNLLVAYLKDSKNNSLKNKLVKFTINSNSFNAFSDCDGKITFNISSSLEAKNYSSTIKFVGDKYYSSSSKSLKVYKLDNNSIESFITELINSKEFSKLLNNSFNSSNQGNFSNKSFNEQNNTEFTQWFMNMSNDEVNFINEFLNLIANSSDKPDFKTISSSLDSNKDLNNNLLEDLWKWLNTPILEIPGYGDLDKKYGVLGQGIKLAGWFLLGIDDNGGLTPLDIGLDALSICSGVGLAERLGISSGSLVLKLADKFPRFNSLLKNSIKIKGLEYSITVKTLFNVYKSTLSLASNPIKFASNKIITNVLDKFDNKIASFAVGYISNSFITVSNVLGITEVYVNAKNNTLFTSKLISNLSNASSIKAIVDSSQSSIASTIKNVKTTVNSVSKAIKTTVNTVTKKLNTVKKAVSSASKTLSKKVTKAVSSVKKTVKKAVNSVKKTVKKVSKVVKSKVTKAVSSVKKTVKKTASSVKKTATKTAKKVTNTAKKVSSTAKNFVNSVKKATVKTVKTAKKAVSSLIRKLF